MEPIFHVAEADAWAAALASGEYRCSTRGRSLDEEGFIHCSYHHQVEGVASRFYRGAGPLVLLTIDPERLGVEVREESAGGAEVFPHVYGPIRVDAVVAVEPFGPTGGG